MRVLDLADPFFLARRALHREVGRMARQVDGVVVDIGCGSAPYRSLFSHARYVGVEVPSRSEHGSSKTGADVFFDGHRLPIGDACVDAVLCSQVLEHVFEPKAFLGELNRVLRPGGHLLLTTPFVWDEHEQPRDYARYSSFGLRHLADTCGFEVVDAHRTLADASLFAQLWLAYVFKVTRGRRRVTLPRRVVIAGASLLANLAGLLMARILPASPDLYLDNAMLLVKPAGVSSDQAGQTAMRGHWTQPPTS